MQPDEPFGHRDMLQSIAFHPPVRRQEVRLQNVMIHGTLNREGKARKRDGLED